MIFQISLGTTSAGPWSLMCPSHWAPSALPNCQTTYTVTVYSDKHSLFFTFLLLTEQCCIHWLPYVLINKCHRKIKICILKITMKELVFQTMTHSFTSVCRRNSFYYNLLPSFIDLLIASQHILLE